MIKRVQKSAYAMSVILTFLGGLAALVVVTALTPAHMRAASVLGVMAAATVAPAIQTKVVSKFTRRGYNSSRS